MNMSFATGLKPRVTPIAKDTKSPFRMNRSAHDGEKQRSRVDEGCKLALRVKGDDLVAATNVLLV